MKRAVESLETRTLMAVSLNSAGWTDITPSSDTRTVYVSASEGSDSNSGLSADAPVKSLAKGTALLRNNAPDHLLLKKGDTWNEGFPAWTKSGRNSQEPIVVGAYGSSDERPHVKAGSKNGFFSNTGFHDVALTGIELEANTRNPESTDYTGTAGGYGIQIIGPVSNFLVQDMYVHHFRYNVSVQGFSGYAKDVTLRRNVITDSYDPGTKSQGFYASQTDGLLLDGNVFDHNGWNEKVSGAGANEFSHNIYLWESNRNATVRNNIIADAGSHGLQARGGGVVENNLFVRNPIGALLGNGSTVTAGGVTGRVSRNVFLESRSIGSNIRGWAIEVGNLKPGGNSVVSDNIITQDTQDKNAAIKIELANGAVNLADAVGVNDLSIERNIIYDWYTGLNIATAFEVGGSGSRALNDLVVRDNDFQDTSSQKIINHSPGFKAGEENFANNRYDSDGGAQSGWFSLEGRTTSLDAWKKSVEPTALAQEMNYPDPDRTIGEYNASVGGSNGRDAFLDRLKSLSRDTWNGKLTAASAISYIRAGFTGATPSETPTNPAPSNPAPNNPAPTTPTLPLPVPDPTPAPAPVNAAPVAKLFANDVTSTGSEHHQFKVTYTDDSEVMTASFGNGDIKVVDADGHAQAATFVGADGTSDGATRTATYMIAAPGGSWDAADNGTYTVNLNPNGVRDTRGKYAPAQTLGTFKADVTAPAHPAPGAGENAPPTVLWSNFDPSEQTISIRFSRDVSAGLNTSDLRLKNEKTLELIPFNQMRMTYDKSTFTATWSFTDTIAIADYKVMLSAPVVFGADGKKLDGNGDGKAGDDHVIRIAAEEMAAAATLASLS